MAISKGLHLISLGFYAFSEGIATPICGLARNDSVYILFAKLPICRVVEQPTEKVLDK